MKNLKPCKANSARWPDERKPRGKKVRPTPSDLTIFSALHRHGPLSTPYLLEFVKGERTNDYRTVQRLKDLFHEDVGGTGPHLSRPNQQFNARKTAETMRSPYLVHDLTPASEQRLKDAGLWSPYRPRRDRSWKHTYGTAAVTASAEIMCRRSSYMRYISEAEVRERYKLETLEFPVTFNDPKTKKPVTKKLIPDALFGIEYVLPGKTLYRLFFVEVDRSTETNKETAEDEDKWASKTYERSFLQYEVLVGGRKYREILGTNVGALVLNVTTSPRRMQNFLDTALKIKPDGCTYMLHGSVREFGTTAFRPVGILDDLVMHPWARAGYGPFDITAV